MGSKLLQSITLSIFLLHITACEKWDLKLESFPEVTTGNFEAGQNPSEGKLNGEISGVLANSFVDNYGHVWGAASGPLPSVENNNGQSLFGKTGSRSFQTELGELAHGRTYSYRAYVLHEGQIYYGEARQFSTGLLSPGLSIDSISRPEGTLTVKLFSSVSNLPPGLSIQSFGITWGRDSLPEITSDPIVQEQGVVVLEPTFQFESEATLPEGKSFFRPFLLAGDKAYYGNSIAYRPSNFWIPKADFGGGVRATAVGFSIGQKGYIGTGTGEGNVLQKDFWEYDPATDSWAQKADFGGGPRDFAVGFSIGQKGYIGTGTDGPYLHNDFWEYDPVANVWARKKNFGGLYRQRAVGFSIGQKGYIGTGWGSTQLFDDFWEYDPATDSWSSKADFGGGETNQAVGFSIGQKGYIGTGWDGIEEHKDFWEYDPMTNTWARKADFGGEPTDFAVGFSIGQKGYIGTGSGWNGYSDDFWEYDQVTGQWTQKANFKGGHRYAAFGFSIGQRGYIGMGIIDTPKNDFWEYTPE